MSEKILELKQVSKWYESADERKILDGLDLSVSEGERFAIVGPSGCGKSTLLNLLGTLDQPSEGSVSVGGIATSGLSEAEIAKVRSEQIGFIFQMHHLLPAMHRAGECPRADVGATGSVETERVNRARQAVNGSRRSRG